MTAISQLLTVTSLSINRFGFGVPILGRNQIQSWGDFRNLGDNKKEGPVGFSDPHTDMKMTSRVAFVAV